MQILEPGYPAQRKNQRIDVDCSDLLIENGPYGEAVPDTAIRLQMSEMLNNHPGANFLFASKSEVGRAFVALTAPNYHRARAISALAIGSLVEVSL